MATHTISWIAPAPMWGRFTASTAEAVDLLSADQTRPAILRFASDDFMDQLIAALAADPKQIGEFLARPETWRTPMGNGPDLVERTPLPQRARLLQRTKNALRPAASLPATADSADLGEPGVTAPTALKLYQPAHQRYYLVAANLVCGIAGFPDRAVASGNHEQVGFVLRRMLPDANATGDLDAQRKQFAYVKNIDGARWQRVAPPDSAASWEDRLLPGEEMLPLFPLNFDDDGSHPRRLLAGLIPVGRREEYMGTRVDYTAPDPALRSPAAATDGSSPVTARKEQFKMEVAEPWKNLVRTAHAFVRRIEDPAGGDAKNGITDLTNAAKSMNDQLQAQSWLILLDFADYLKTHLRPVWDAIANAGPGTGNLNDAQAKLLDWLGKAVPITSGRQLLLTKVTLILNTPALAPSLRDALRQIGATGVREGLEGAVQSYPDSPRATPGNPVLAWPPFFYQVAGVTVTVPLPSYPPDPGKFAAAGPHEIFSTVPQGDAPVEADDTDPDAPATMSAKLRDAEANAALVDKLVQLVVRAIDDTRVAPSPAPPLPYAMRLRDALKTTSADPGWFVLRCVYQRCDCGPLHPPTLSAPTQRFQLASFFDTDAPARPIRISLPRDTTPAGMRKFNKNTAFVISDVLCGQMQRAKGLGLVDLVMSVLPWPLHKDLDIGGTGTCQSGSTSIGMICSLSIPIITICALILLMIIVSLLDMIFRWMPYFIMCFPIPGLKGKK